GQSQTTEEPAETKDKKGKAGKKPAIPALDAIGALGIFDRKSAVAMVASSASAGFDSSGTPTPAATIAPRISKENLQSAMQWGLGTPWATFYELSSPPPLVAHRLQYLSDQAAAMGDEPYIVFDRRKPESYWDDFLADVLVMFLPLVLLAVGMGIA